MVTEVKNTKNRGGRNMPIFYFLFKILVRVFIIPVIVFIGWTLIKKLRNKSYREIKEEMIG